MKISICIPQYNRIAHLLKSLYVIQDQRYADIEIVISDDCSSDKTEEEIRKLALNYKYPVTYSRNTQNCGYDRNYRKSIELATGDYCIILGNDDTLYDPNSIGFLVDFLQANNYPEIGFCNFVEDQARTNIIQRTHQTQVIGTGADVALHHYSCFSFVGGLIYKRNTFLQHNTDKQDGSIYAQLYLGVLMIVKGCRLFSIKEPLIIKDLYIEGAFRSSYRQRLARSWKEYKRVDGGMPSVINALICAFRDAGALSQQVIYSIFKHIYSLTYPHWLLDYRSNKAFPEAAGLARGMSPFLNSNYKLLGVWNRFKILSRYFFSSLIGLLTPVIIFTKLKSRLYKFFKR